MDEVFQWVIFALLVLFVVSAVGVHVAQRIKRRQP
jgi:hypothetical protein